MTTNIMLYNISFCDRNLNKTAMTYPLKQLFGSIQTHICYTSNKSTIYNGWRKHRNPPKHFFTIQRKDKHISKIRQMLKFTWSTSLKNPSRYSECRINNKRCTKWTRLCQFSLMIINEYNFLNVEAFIILKMIRISINPC